MLKVTKNFIQRWTNLATVLLMLSFCSGLFTFAPGSLGRANLFSELTQKTTILGFHCHAIEKKNPNHSMNEVKKLTWYRG